MNYDGITLDTIEDLRLEMIELADTKGYTHEDTVIVSQALDSMMNQYSVLTQD